MLINYIVDNCWDAYNNNNCENFGLFYSKIVNHK